MTISRALIRLPVLLLALLLRIAPDASAAEPAAPPRAALSPATLSVEVIGVEDPLLGNILSFLAIEQEKSDQALTAERIERLHERAPEEIRRALQPFGYYTPEIRSDLVRSGRLWTARYVVEPGRPVLIGDIDLVITGEGSGNDRIERVRRDLPISIGDRLVHPRYERAKQELLEAATDQGYLDAEFLTSVVEVYPERHTAAVTLHLDTGPLYRFGEVTFEQEALRPEFLARYVPFDEGDPFRLSGLLELQNALGDSDYFSSVEVEPRYAEAEDLTVPVDVKLVPRKRQRYTVGAGYGTDTGFRAILGWENRRVNRRGHRFTSELRLSEIRQSLTARYLIPMKNPRTDRLEFSTGISEEDTKTSESRIYALGASYTRKRGEWQATFYTNLQQERFSVGDEEGSSRLIIPGTIWTRYKANDPIYVTHGSRITLELKGAHTALLSDTSFIQFRAATSFIRSPWRSGRVLLRAGFGFSQVERFRDLPASQRFFAGGDRSVRGYGYNTLGPKRDGNVIGGKHLIEGSVEYERRLTSSWSAAAFYDVGNALNNLSDPLKQGAGVGVRWKSPVGLVRVDVALALDPEPDERQWRIHLNIGPDL
ncbi:MAG: autotransporter assembly complex family protein [Nitrospirota bacterium]